MKAGQCPCRPSAHQATPRLAGWAHGTSAAGAVPVGRRSRRPLQRPCAPAQVPTRTRLDWAALAVPRGQCPGAHTLLPSPLPVPRGPATVSGCPCSPPAPSLHRHTQAAAALPTFPAPLRAAPCTGTGTGHRNSLGTTVLSRPSRRRRHIEHKGRETCNKVAKVPVQDT